MENWVRETLGLTLAELGTAVSVAGFVLALLSVTVPPLRRARLQALDRALILSGSTRRRYLRWFRKEHQKVKNIYLDREEVLDLSTTYIPLAVSGAGLSGRLSAAAVLANPERDRVIVVGEPGSGKSTLLKAFGAALASRQFRTDHTHFRTLGRPKEVPILIQLRRLGAALQERPGLTLREYITRNVLMEGAKLKRSSVFLDRLLQKRRCLLMLDGLDEVPKELYPAVRSRILEWLDETAGDDRDAGAIRVVLTCRDQNFLGIADDWMPQFSSTQFTLTPLRDDEVLEFLRRRGGYQERKGQSPDAFYADIQGSGMMGMHRVPLILTISLGLYLNLAVYRIPRSRPAFYAEMIKELLRRRDFPADPHASVERNRFNWEEKERFLRQLALAMAERPNKFDEFTYQEIYTHADSLAGKVAHLSPGQVRDFVKEIIDSSGLLSRVAGAREADEDVYIFAHRAVHEYLASVQLARRSAAAAETLLLQRSSDPLWREIALLYAALGPEEQVPGLLERLVERNLELAGHCLAEATQVPSELAPKVISRLSDAVGSSTDEECLAALVACCGSEVANVRDYATATLTEVLLHVRPGGDEAGLPQLVKLEDAQLVALVEQLATVASEDAVRLISHICTHVDHQLQLIRPLWRCLAVEEASAEAGSLVHHLLRLVGTQEGRHILDEQPAYSPSFATDRARRQAYPFDRGHGRNSNFVTLLTWADRLPMAREARETSDLLTSYFGAKSEDLAAFDRLEADRHRRLTVIRPYWFGALLFLGGYLGAGATIGRVLLQQGWSGLLVSDPWWWQIAAVAGASLLAGVAAGFVVEVPNENFKMHTVTDPTPSNNSLPPFNPYSAISESSIAIVFQRIEEPPIYMGPLTRRYASLKIGTFDWRFPSSVLGFVIWMAVASSPISFVVSLLLSGNMWSTLAVGSLAGLLLFWFPMFKLFARDTKLYLRPPNPFLHLYDDPATAHWLVRDAQDSEL